MKKIFKNATALLLSVVLFSPIAPLATSATDTEEIIADFTYTIADGSVTITGYNIEAEKIVIPQSIEGYPVTQIGANAFKKCSGIKEIVLPETLETIGAYAFAQSSLDTVVIPSSVKKIDNYAYFECDIEEITLKNGIESIGDYAFYDALDLCTNQGDFLPLNIPESVNNIGYLAFNGDVNVPFIIEVDSANQYYSSEDNVLFNKDKTVLIQFSSARGGNRDLYGTSYKIPDTVEAIGDYAFYGEWPISELTFGKNVKTIGDYAFSQNKLIKKINFNVGLESIGEGAFYESSDIEYNLPDSVTSIGASAFSLSSSYRFVIPSGVTEINEWSFAGGIKYIYIPLSVKKISKNAFGRKLEFICYEGSEEQWNENIGAQSFYTYGCDFYYNISDSSHEHIGDYWEVTQEATCTVDGVESCYCVVCMEVIETRAISANGYHADFVNKVFYSNDCEINGMTCLVCSKCDEIIAVIEKPVGHKCEWQVTTPATCTENGKEAHVCTICKKTFEEREVGVLGHVAGEWVVLKQPTYTQNGEIALLCATCGAVIETKSLDKLAPKISSVVLSDIKVDYEGKSKLDLKVSAAGDIDYSVKYSVDDDSIISIDKKGEVTGLKRGSTKVTVTVTDEDGNEYKDTCKVTVKYNLRQWVIYIICLGWLWM